ncbi:MAG: S-layer homology domain-containing protein [Oscillospiraceae bacterium]|nr:S-layer homology domain-containing protein [Oscillospiraceae bacterium]
MKKIKQLLATVLILVLSLTLMPIGMVYAAQATGLPLYNSITEVLVADEGTQYITSFMQDPSTKLITATIQIHHAGIEKDSLMISGVGLQISFDNRVAPYSPGELNPYFTGKSIGDIPLFNKYVKALMSGFDSIGSTAIQNDANGRYLGAKISCAKDGETIEIKAGQTVDIAEYYFMPLNGQMLDKDMFRYEFTHVQEAFLRLSAWIGNGTTFLQSSNDNIQSPNTYVKPEAFVIQGPWEADSVVPSVRKIGVVNNTRNDGTTQVGDELIYTITISNTGLDGSIWVNAVMTDTLNQYVNYVAGSASIQPSGSGTIDYDSTTRTLTAQLGNIVKGEIRTIVFNVTVASNALNQNISNFVKVTGKDGPNSDADDIIKEVKEDGNDRIVTPPVTLSKLSTPTINTVYAGDTSISGTGTSGATINVRMPNNTIVTATVTATGTWAVSIPSGTTLLTNNVITGWQTQSGMQDSNTVSITVVTRPSPSTPGGGNPSGGTTTIPSTPPPLAGFLADHVPYLNGYPDNSVRPNHPITRAEAASIFFRLLSAIDKDYPLPSVFSDIREGVWYSQAVSYLASIRIITGYPDGTFRPDQPITRAEFAAMASRFDNLAETYTNAFTDIANHWAVSVINSSYAKGWISGYPDGTFRPQQNINRAEVVTVVNKMLDRKVRLEDIPTGIKVFNDINTTHWAYTAIVEASNDHDFIRGADGYETWRLK